MTYHLSTNWTLLNESSGILQNRTVHYVEVITSASAPADDALGLIVGPNQMIQYSCSDGKHAYARCASTSFSALAIVDDCVNFKTPASGGSSGAGVDLVVVDNAIKTHNEATDAHAVIFNDYVKDISANDNTLTVTKGDGSTQDVSIGSIVYENAAVGIALVQSGGGAGIWVQVDPDGNGLPTQNFSYLYPWNTIKKVSIDGQIMVKIPKFYVKYGEAAEGSEYAGKKCHWVSKTKKDDYHVHPAFVRNGEEKDYFLIGAYEAFNDGGKAGSKRAQTPWINIGGHANAISRCEARNTNANDAAKRGWHLQTVYERAAISLLMLIELGTPDVQSVIGAGNVLSSAAVATGSTAAKWRGIFEYWGNVWEHVDGFKTGANSKGQIFSTRGDGTYVDTGVTVADGWITEMSEAAGTNFDLTDVFVPSVSDGTEADGTYADCCLVAADCVLYQSGSWGSDSRCGAFTFNAGSAASVSDSSLGLRLENTQTDRSRADVQAILDVTPKRDLKWGNVSDVHSLNKTAAKPYMTRYRGCYVCHKKSLFKNLIYKQCNIREA